MSTTLSAPTITESLCEAFALAADLLLQRRAAAIAERDIDDFVALGWMNWRGGSLVITPLGQMALVRMRTRLHEAVA